MEIYRPLGADGAGRFDLNSSFGRAAFGNKIAKLVKPFLPKWGRYAVIVFPRGKTGSLNSFVNTNAFGYELRPLLHYWAQRNFKEPGGKHGKSFAKVMEEIRAKLYRKKLEHQLPKNPPGQFQKVPDRVLYVPEKKDPSPPVAEVKQQFQGLTEQELLKWD